MGLVWRYGDSLTANRHLKLLNQLYAFSHGHICLEKEAFLPLGKPVWDRPAMGQIVDLHVVGVQHLHF